MFGWRRYLSIEEDFLQARYYVAFDVKTAHSDFLSKSIILLGAEIEHAFKKLCELIDEKAKRGSIADYKKIILQEMPGIVNLKSTLRENEEVQFFPFKDWQKGRLSWWTIHNNVKHHKDGEKKATMKVALNMLSAYQLLLFLIEGYNGEESHTAYTQIEIPRVLVPDIRMGPGQTTQHEGIFCWIFDTSDLKEKLSQK